MLAVNLAHFAACAFRRLGRSLADLTMLPISSPTSQMAQRQIWRCHSGDLAPWLLLQRLPALLVTLFLGLPARMSLCAS
jgi:hypothetical protein